MQRQSHWLVLGALATVVVACSSPMGNNNVPTDVVSTQDSLTPTDTPVSDAQSPIDRPSGQDGGSMDASKGDASTTDGATGDGATGDGATDDATKGDASRADVVPVDAPPGTGVCAPSAVIDLNAMGTTMGTTTRITRNNNSADAMSPLTTSCTGSTGHEVVFRYTPRTAARLRVSTDNAGTDENFDTVVFARSACAGALGDGGVTEFGCNDDSGGTRGRASTFTTTAPVAMGTPIYLVVAGYTPTTGAPYTEQGTFELSVTEITVAPIGGTCDPTGVTSTCAGGARCAANAASGDAAVTGTCIADGAAGGRCRATTSDAGAGACDTGLTCTGGRCLRAIPLGSACERGSATSACASGGYCAPGDGGTTGVCIDAAAPYDPCAASAVIDLNAMGSTAGTTTRITRNNHGVGTMSPLSTSCTTSTGHEVVFRYTPRTAARLRVSTDNAGTDENLDTVVFARSACAGALGDGGVTELGCNDDNGSATRTRASTFTTTSAVTAGAPIYLVVAGYTPAAGAFTEQGSFELTVIELTVAPVGGACDPTGVTSSCATGSRCVEGAATGDAGATGTCVADGARNGNCRAATADGGVAACDAGLVCAGGLCLPTIAAGGACGPGVVGACVTGTSCGGLSGAQRCIADGALGGACRTGSACDTGLMCDTGTCIRNVASGGACDPYDPAVVCATGTSCAPAAAGSTCQSDGTVGGSRCRAAAPLCDTGLTCDGMTRAVCRSAGTLGGACNVRLNNVACPTGAACLATSATAATCAMGRAETEPNNAPAMPQSAVTSSTVFSGSLGSGDAGADPADCYAVTVPANGTVIAETSAPGHPGCEANDTVATLYNAAGAQVATNDDGDRHGLCSLLVAPSLTAGTYALCVRPYTPGGAIASYLVSISVYGP